MKVANFLWIGLAFLCAATTCAAPFLLGNVGFSREPPWTDRVTEAQRTKLGRETGLVLPADSRFLLYGEDSGLDEHIYYKLRLTDGEVHSLLAQRSLKGADWGRGNPLGAPDSPPGWKPGRRRKSRTTQVSIERKPGGRKATYLNVTIDPNEDGSDDIYLELGYS